MSTVIITISKRSYSTRNRALGVAKQAISREMNILANPSGDPLFWTLDNVVVEEAEDGWRWHVEIDMPSTEDAMAEVEAQERLDMEDEAYFERIASENKEKAQAEAPRELTVEQALEIAAQQTEAVDEEFRAVEARRKAEAEQKDKALQRLAEFNQCDMDIATSMGRDALETAISRMEDAVQLLKRRLADFNDADRAGARANYLSWAANDLRNADFNDMRLLIAEYAGMLEALGATRVHIEHFSEK